MRFSGSGCVSPPRGRCHAKRRFCRLQASLRSHVSVWPLMLKTEATAPTEERAFPSAGGPRAPSGAPDAVFVLGRGTGRRAESEPSDGFFSERGRSLITSEGWTQEASEHIFLSPELKTSLIFQRNSVPMKFPMGLKCDPESVETAGGGAADCPPALSVAGSGFSPRRGKNRAASLVKQLYSRAWWQNAASPLLWNGPRSGEVEWAGFSLTMFTTTLA